ncbi:MULTISPECIES: class I fructose-bisphosphate aldolase [Sphingomonas]|uniref:class I fructose-bisphosphate aldolase n=1 Tax=Sphingomonas TaxID=13687 RepID=UPI0006FB4146|nr:MULTISPECIES: class I fructose-bisphosphate aldolase [unclassified Sphingomonas]KQN05781.1 fructose-bisphosphate aldolase [Sphingomonas sp. Leaf230]SFN75798.1 fructose-bisphosphate aldolase [Sphingomonas sp. OK281]
MTSTITPQVKTILDKYEATSSAVKANLARILMQGKLGGTGKLVILPVDQGFEHGPARSFSVNPPAYDPHYHYQLAIDAGLSAYAAPLGMLEAGADTFAGQIPTILKCNSSNSWATTIDQAVTATVSDAVRLGSAAIGFTIYPGADQFFDLVEEIRELSEEAKSVGIATVIWSYPRGGELTKDGELALDVGAYAAHMAALLGAHIIKTKLPTAHIEQKEAKPLYANTDWSKQSDRVKHVVQSSFAGRRINVFSGGASKGEDAIFQDARDIRDGGGNGSIIGRNTFQRPRDEALAMLDRIIRIYKNEE